MKTEGTINWLDSCIVCDGRQERRKEGMPPGMSESVEVVYRVVGKGTEQFPRLRDNDTVQLMGPLGDGLTFTVL